MNMQTNIHKNINYFFDINEGDLGLIEDKLPNEIVVLISLHLFNEILTELEFDPFFDISRHFIFVSHFLLFLHRSVLLSLNFFSFIFVFVECNVILSCVPIHLIERLKTNVKDFSQVQLGL